MLSTLQPQYRMHVMIALTASTKCEEHFSASMSSGEDTAKQNLAKP